MRKILCFILLMCLLLTACDNGDVAEQVTPAPTAELTATPTPMPTPEPTPAPAPTFSEEPAELTMYLEGDAYAVTGFRYSSHLGYSMIYDPDWVRPDQYEGYDHYTAVTEVHVPELYMRVTRTDSTMEQVIGDLKAQGAEEVGTVLFGGCRGVQLSKMSGLSPSDVVVQHYVILAGDTVYVLETSYFWEVAEGFGSRMWFMLSTIAFTDAPAATELKLIFRDKELKDFTSAIGDVTYVTLCPDAGASLEAAVWSTDNEDVCDLYSDDTGCYIEIKGEGFAKVTAKCGDLEQTVFVRAIKEW